VSDRYTRTNPGLRAWLLDELARRHRGAANAITWQELAGEARRAGFRVERDERNLREEVNELQAAGGTGALIISSSRPPYGVFVAETMDEVDGYLATLESRIAALATKAKTQRTAARAAFEARVEQMRLM
jgi:hypothetical protein